MLCSIFSREVASRRGPWSWTEPWSLDRGGMSLNFAEGEGGGARPPVASTPLERPIRAPARSARAILLFSVGHGRQGARVLLKRAHWVHLRRSLRVAVSRENARGMFKSKCTCVYVLCWFDLLCSVCVVFISIFHFVYVLFT